MDDFIKIAELDPDYEYYNYLSDTLKMNFEFWLFQSLQRLTIFKRMLFWFKLLPILFVQPFVKTNPKLAITSTCQKLNNIVAHVRIGDCLKTKLTKLIRKQFPHVLIVRADRWVFNRKIVSWFPAILPRPDLYFRFWIYYLRLVVNRDRLLQEASKNMF